jgi:hypothetical protein
MSSDQPFELFFKAAITIGIPYESAKDAGLRSACLQHAMHGSSDCDVGSAGMECVATALKSLCSHVLCH